MFLGGGQDEQGVGWGFLQQLQKGIEGGGAEHMHLVDDVHLFAAYLRGDLHLQDQVDLILII